MSSSFRRSRFRVRVQEEDPVVDPIEDERSRSNTESSTDPGEEEGDLESMTGKGIKRLCSELLELKRVSDEDFQRNVYSNYYTFVRIFEEVEDVDSDIAQLKDCASAQSKLIQSLMNNLYADMIIDGLKDSKPEDLGLSSPSSLEIHMQDVLLTLDTLLLELRLNEALAILEKENLTLKGLQIKGDHSSPIVMSYTYALAERRTRVSDLLALMAEHPRVAQPELLQALSGLCKLGEHDRANSLLVKFYHSRLKKKVELLQCSEPCLYGSYIRELAKIVFSAISEAARCFITLYGDISPYASELILWAREEIGDFSEKFCAYIKSISEMNGGISLAVEAANSAISLCSLLNSQRIVMLPTFVELIRPSMEEVLQMHVDHFKKVVHLFSTSDNWVLGKFLTLGILRNKSSLMGIGQKVKYCHLTSSGRKFVTIVQAIVDDISPLVNLGMGSSILKGLVDLFSEFMHTLKRAISTTVTTVENNSSKVSSARTLTQKLSLLANASTLVQFFPSIAASVFKAIKSPDNDLLSKQTAIFSQNELDNLISLIEEIADQLQGCFCQQFVVNVMSHGGSDLATGSNGWCIPSSTQDLVPSFAFQALFMQLRQLQQLSESISEGEDGMIKRLPKEIMETVMVWLSNNREFWANTVESSYIRQSSCFDQVLLDMHFLMEIALFGGHCSDDLISEAMDLIEEMEVAFIKTESEQDGCVPNESSVLDAAKMASDAAKLAIEKLLDVEASNLKPKIEQVSTSMGASRTQNLEDNYPSEVADLIDLSEHSTDTVNGDPVSSLDDEVTSLVAIKDSDEADEFSGSEDIGEELEFGGVTGNSNVESVTYLGEFDNALALQTEADDPQVIPEKKNVLPENIVLENPEVESVNNLYELDALAAKLTIKDPEEIYGNDSFSMEARLLDTCPKLDPVDDMHEYFNFTAQPESEANRLKGIEALEKLEANKEASDCLNEYDAIEDQTGVNEQNHDNTEKRNILTKRWLSNPAYDLNLSSSFKNSDAIVSSEVEATRLDLDEKLVIIEENENSFAMLKEIVEVDVSNVKDEPATVDRDSIQKRQGGGVSVSTRPRVAKKRYRTTGEGLIRANSNLPHETKLVNLEHFISSLTASEELVQVEGSKVEGEPNSEGRDRLPSEMGSNIIASILSFQAKEKGMVKLKDDSSPMLLEENVQFDKAELEGDLEKPSFEDKDKLLSETFSQLGLVASRRKQEVGIICGEDSEKNVLQNENSNNSDSEGDSKGLVQIYRSNIEGGPAIHEKPTVNDEENILSDNIPAIALDASLQNPGGVVVIHLEINENTSNEPAEILQIDSEEDGNGKNSMELKDRADPPIKDRSINVEEKVLLHVDDCKVAGEAATSKPLRTEKEEEKLLASKISELTLEASQEKQGSDSSNTTGSTGESSGNGVQQRGGRKRSKSISEENLNLVKSGKGAKGLRSRWH